MNRPYNDSADAFNQAAKSYCAALRHDSTSMIKNVDTKVEIFDIDGFQLPMTINNTEWDNSYVCSPYTALHGYCLEELEKVDSRIFRGLARPAIKGIGKYMKNKVINQNIHINNWLLSTNLYSSSFAGHTLAEKTQYLIDSYPEHALIFRSLNEFSNAKLLQQMQNAGYLLVPSRQLYIYEPKLSNFSRKSDFKRDVKLLKRQDYHLVLETDIQPSDFKRIVELYNALYINKYSVFNPMFTEKYIEHILQNPAFELYGFRNKEGILDAIGARYTIDGVTSLPIVGYDTRLSVKTALYRRVLIATNIYALEHQLTFNASSGASHFKMQRGASPLIEYSAIYIQHLPPHRQHVWHLINAIISKVGVPIIKKYQL